MSRQAKATERTRAASLPAGTPETRRNSKINSDITDSTLAEIRDLECHPLPTPDIKMFHRNLDAEDAISQHFSGQAGPADPNVTCAGLLQSSPELPGRRQ